MLLREQHSTSAPRPVLLPLPGGPSSTSLPRLPDHTYTCRHTSSLNQDTQRHVCSRAANWMGAKRRTTHYGSRPSSADRPLQAYQRQLGSSAKVHACPLFSGHTQGTPKSPRGKGRHAEVEGTSWVTVMASSWSSMWNKPLCQNRQILRTGSQTGGWRPHDVITKPS